MLTGDQILAEIARLSGHTPTGWTARYPDLAGLKARTMDDLCRALGINEWREPPAYDPFPPPSVLFGLPIFTDPDMPPDAVAAIDHRGNVLAEWLTPTSQETP